VQPESLVTGMGKVWGQRTTDGRYALVYNPDRERRWPLAMLTSDDGITFRDPHALHGELPPRRYEGKAKASGASYHRGLSKWNDDGSWKDNALWMVYSLNKEEIRVIRAPLPAVEAKSTSAVPAGGAVAAAAVEIPVKSGPLEAISVSGFHDSVHHWRTIRDEGRFMKAEPDQPSYQPSQVREIVSNILLFQRPNGGWPKDYDMTAILTEEQKAAIVASRTRNDSSFDNGNLHAQIEYLARAYAEAGEPAWRDACLRGLDYVFAAQYPNGGFPQRYPKATDFHAYITFNDGVMIGCMNLLKDAADREPHFAWLDEARREKARDAVRRGLECILKCQIRVDGKLTGWCQQHDQTSYEARPGRTFELASICPQDSTETVEFLMRFEAPKPEIVHAVDAAVEWLRTVKLSGVRVETVKAPKEEFQRYTADYDRVVVQDPQAPPLWARHYEIGTNRPVFAGRDGVRKYAFAEIERERRTGTPWFGKWPEKLIEEEYLAWRKKAGE
jgi:PelA/Pel-15E family pectate lyase